MEEKIQLEHPLGKNAIRIDKSKYYILKLTILKALEHKALTYKELYQKVEEDFNKNNVNFEGNVEWYMESVKLDLEAKKLIKRKKEKSKLYFEIT